MDGGRAGQARARAGPYRGRRAALPRRARDRPRLRVRARAARAGGSRTRSPRQRCRAGAPRRRGDPAAAIRGTARRRARTPGQGRGGAAPAGHRRRNRSPPRRQRRHRGPRVCGVSGRPRDRPGDDGGARPQGSRAPGRPSTATMPSPGLSHVPVAAPRRCRGRSALFGWARATPSSGSTGATPPAAPATSTACAPGTGRRWR